MAIYITDDCISCGACTSECPTNAIRESKKIYVINANACTGYVGFYDHDACQAVCPVECCLPDPQNVESEAVLIARAMRLRPDDGELRQKSAANEYPSRIRK